jgi:hypothetical protein
MINCGENHMIYLIRVTTKSNGFNVGDCVEYGDIVGRNIRTLEEVQSPITGVVTDILDALNRHAVILVVESDVPMEAG